MELKNRIHKWLQQIEGPVDWDARSSDTISIDNNFADDGIFNESILYHPDFSEWALAEDLKRQSQLEKEGSINLFSVLNQAQSSLSRFMRDNFSLDERQ